MPIGIFGRGSGLRVARHRVATRKCLLVGSDGERAAVRRRRDRLHVPVAAFAEVVDRSERDVEPCETSELAIAIGGQDGPLPSRAKLRSLLAIGFAAVVPRRAEGAACAGADVHHPDVRLVDRFVLDQAESPIVERERVIAPAGAGERRDLAGYCDPRGSTSARSVVGARGGGLVDIGRVDEQPVARMGIPAGSFLRAASVGSTGARRSDRVDRFAVARCLRRRARRRDVGRLSATTCRNEPARRNRSIA